MAGKVCAHAGLVPIWLALRRRRNLDHCIEILGIRPHRLRRFAFRRRRIAGQPRRRGGDHHRTEGHCPPGDQDHEFGHSKAGYFAVGLEGTLIFVAAAYIIYVSGLRLLDPQPIHQVGWGLAVMVVASLINLLVATVLIRVGRENNSMALVADGKHLMADVWTTAGVVAGVILVWATGIWWFDPLIAMAVALNILLTGRRLVLDAGNGLMDRAMSGPDRAAVDEILERHKNPELGIDVHEIRTRESGHQRFIEFHVLVPGQWTVERGHDVVEAMEEELRLRFAGVHITSHLEPIEDERAYGDVHL